MVAYIPLNKCTSRQDETLQSKVDQTISADSSGNLRLSKKQKTEDTRLEGEHRLKMAFQRRSMANDIANIGSFQVMDRWTQSLFDKLNEQPPAGHRPISIDQIIQADKTLWIKLADETRADISTAVVGGAEKPFDRAFKSLTQNHEVLIHLTPLLASSSSFHSTSDKADHGFPRAPQQQQQQPKGKGPSDKGKGKGPGIAVPDNCTIVANGKTLCKKFNVGRCGAKIKPGKRCMNGYHLCWRKSCHKPHPGSECTMA